MVRWLSRCTWKRAIPTIHVPVYANENYRVLRIESQFHSTMHPNRVTFWTCTTGRNSKSAVIWELSVILICPRVTLEMGFFVCSGGGVSFVTLLDLGMRNEKSKSGSESNDFDEIYPLVLSSDSGRASPKGDDDASDVKGAARVH